MIMMTVMCDPSLYDFLIHKLEIKQELFGTRGN